MSERNLVACRICGYVEARQPDEQGVKRCLECARPMGGIQLEEARQLVRKRREADRRRADAEKVAEVGLDLQP